MTDDLWLDMARRANAAGQRIANGLRNIDGVDLLHEPQANMIYAALPTAAHMRLAAAGAQYYPEAGATERPEDATSSARIVADWSCPDENIARFLDLVAG